jgi:hypothetical protein
MVRVRGDGEEFGGAAAERFHLLAGNALAALIDLDSSSA